MKKWDDINVEEKLSSEDFLTLFLHLPLNEKEKRELLNYYKMYETFLSAEVAPVNAWIAIRNVFAIKNQQIADRVKNNTLSL